MIYFISDLHLGNGDRTDAERISYFLQWLRAIAIDAEQLFLVGDIFDYWFDYRTVIPKTFYRIAAALTDLRESGVQIHYIIGNHDFGHYEFFEKNVGAQIYWNDYTPIINQKKFYISHGDGKFPKDRGYLLLRSLLRNRIAQRLYRLIHPDIGIALASFSSQKSRQHTQAEDPENEAYLRAFARKKIAEGYDFVIMGHIHKPIMLQFNGGIYVNLGDWLKHDTFALFDGERIHLLHREEFLAERLQMRTATV